MRMSKTAIAVAIAAGLSFSAMAQAPASKAAPAPAQAGVKQLKMQSTWPASLTLQDNFKYWAERVEKLTRGEVRIEAMAAGQIVPAFEILDATHKKVIDGGHGVAYYWVGKNKTATLFSATPAGPFGMDHFDFLGWMYEGGGMELYWDFYKDILKLNIVAWPVKNLADLKGMKCRETGIVNEIYQRMGMSTVNMPGGEIVPSAQRGVIDCAEWVGGVEDLRLGLPQVWKYHYTPGMHESNSMLEVMMNSDVWKGLSANQQEAVRSAVSETFVRWGVRWQKQNADAIEEMQKKYGTQILRTPPELHTAFLKTWVPAVFVRRELLLPGRRAQGRGGEREEEVTTALSLTRGAPGRPSFFAC